MTFYFRFLLLFITLNASAQPSFNEFIKKIESSIDSKSALQSLDSIAKKKKLSEMKMCSWYSAYIRHAHTLNMLDVALKYSLKGIDIAEHRKNDSLKSVFLRWEGITYYLSGQKKHAITSFKRGIEVSHKINFYDAEAACLNNLGAIYIEIEKFEPAEVCLLRSIELMKKIHKENSVSAIRTYRLLAYLYDNQKNYPAARSIYLRVIKLAEKAGDSNMLSAAHLYYGNHFVSLQQYDSAIYYNKIGVDYMKTSRDKPSLMASLTMQVDLYEKIKDYKNAFYTARELSKVGASLNYSETNKKISDIRIKYDTEKKEQDLKLSKIQLIQSQQRSNFILIMSVLVILILMILSLFIYFRIKWKQKIVDEIERIKKEQEISDSKEHERSRIARELHDNIGSTISFITNKTELILKNQEENQFNTADLIQVKESAQEVMGDLRETLWALNVRNISNFDLADKLKVYIKKHALVPIKITEDLSEEKIIPNESALAIFRCCQEIINNCNKYSQATSIAIAIFSVNGSLFNITISDDGIGFDLEEKDGHYGLRNMKTRMNEINADFSIQSEKNVGTEIRIGL